MRLAEWAGEKKKVYKKKVYNAGGFFQLFDKAICEVNK